MRVRWIAFVIIAVCGGIIYFIGKDIPSELAPMEDRSQFRLQVTAPEGTSYDYMDKYIDRLIQLHAGFCSGKAERYLSVTAPGFTGSGATNSGFVRVTLTDPKERNRSQKEIVDMVNRNLPSFNEGRAFAIQEQTFL